VISFTFANSLEVPVTTTDAQGRPTTSTSTQAAGLPGGNSSNGSPLGDTVTTVTTTDMNGQATTYPETLVPTTTTDSSGRIYTGTITEAPETTYPPNPSLTTFTTFPSGISWSTTSAASNTYDSNGYPVLGPWPLCWFCPPGSNGIVLFWYRT